MGAGTRLCGDRHCGHRRYRGQAKADALAGTGAARRNGLYGQTRNPARDASRPAAGHPVGHLHPPALLACGGRSPATSRCPRASLRLPLCPRARLSQDDASATPATHRPPAPGSGSATLDRILCLPCVFRFGTGAGNRVCGAIGRCLARQAHAVADACRIVAFSRRNLYHLAAAPRQTDRRSLR